MRLERLELAGFKSFSDRAEVAFDRGVTAIVGPNGCGKSNLADALTWVLGEQSAKSLRGDKMEDVIFSGSDGRKPTGTAEVRLRLSGVPAPAEAEPAPVLEPVGVGVAVEEAHGAGAGTNGSNGHESHAAVMELLDAFRDVEVTRRLYRSGESEYLIDGQTCRLRDIHELLMDTGLGAKAYSIIEQGKIGMILSSRPTDRRALIEEAAGITKYKARRRASELKLEAAQQNLTRIDDIVFEVGKQRGSLKRQAAKARRYARLRDEMRRWEKVLFAERYRGLGDSIESARSRLGTAREQERLAAARLSELEATLQQLRLELTEAEEAAAQATAAAHGGELAINQRQQQIALDTQRATMLDARGRELDAELHELSARREPERLALAARREALQSALRDRDRAAAEAAERSAAFTEAQNGIRTRESAVEHARNEVYAVHNTITALEAAIAAAATERDRAAEALGRLEGEAADLRTEIGRAASARDLAAGHLQTAQADVQSLREARTAREAELTALRADHEARVRDVRAREQALASVAARLRSLEELDADRAGFGDAARMVLAEASGRIGQLGALADFLEVAPRHERAVEACLGDLLQHALVERRDQAAVGLALVRHENAGRCGFVIVGAPGTEEIRPNGTAETAVGGDRVHLSSVVHVTGPYAAAIRSAIGDALIVESLDGAEAMAAESGLRVVTLDGDLLHAPHVVSGGGRAEARGILATKREIKTLREQVESDRRTLGELAAEVEQMAGAVAAIGQTIAGLTADLHEREKSIVAVDAQLQRARDEERRLEQRAAMVANESRQRREEIAALDARQAEASESVGRLRDDRAAAEATLAERQRQLAVARDEAQASGQQAAEARATQAALVERASSAQAEVVRMEQAAIELERRVETCAADLQTMRGQRETLQASAADGQLRLDQEQQALAALRTTLLDAEGRAGAVKASAEQQETVIRDARQGLDTVRALVAELDVTRATAEADLTHLAQQCLDSVGASLDEVLVEVEQRAAAGEAAPDAASVVQAAEDEPGDGEDLDDAATNEPMAAPEATRPLTAEGAITALRTKIDRLGPVNMMAIEQFDELETRHTFLTTQRQDLIDSIAQANEAIKRIDETTHARFREAFAVINRNFQETFQTLFGGGRAGLTLLDESDPLESGIDIVASPPGKRLQSVQLLSGGEKALTAISLMFAIFRYKPSPFCLLDEIDAPLDDANIGRFVEMLRSMLDHTQFIIITHNRKTMEIANRLYGVTMEEPGVSKLISLNLN